MNEAELIKQEFVESIKYEASNQLFKKKMNSVRKRDRKQSDKLSSTSGTSTSAAAAVHMMHSNFMQDI